MKYESKKKRKKAFRPASVEDNNAGKKHRQERVGLGKSFKTCKSKVFHLE